MLNLQKPIRWGIVLNSGKQTDNLYFCLAKSLEDLEDTGLSGLYEISQMETVMIDGWCIAGLIISGANIYCDLKIRQVRFK